MRKIIEKSSTFHTDLYFFKFCNLYFLTSVSTSNVCRFEFAANFFLRSRQVFFVWVLLQILSNLHLYLFIPLLPPISFDGITLTAMPHRDVTCKASSFSRSCKIKFLQLSFYFPVNSLYKIQLFNIDIPKILWKSLIGKRHVPDLMYTGVSFGLCLLIKLNGLGCLFLISSMVTLEWRELSIVTCFLLLSLIRRYRYIIIHLE